MKKEETMRRAITFGNRLNEIRRSTLHTLCLAVVALWVLLPAVGMANPLDTWHWRNPVPQGNPLESIAYGNGTFVVVGDGGTILTSPDQLSCFNRLHSARKQKRRRFLAWPTS